MGEGVVAVVAVVVVGGAVAGDSQGSKGSMDTVVNRVLGVGLG